MKVEIRQVSSTTCDYIDILRRSPVRYIAGAEMHINRCLSMSEDVYVGRIEDQIACVWGLIPPTLMSERAYLWLLTTDLMAEHPFILVRRSQIVMADLLTRYPTIVGNCIVGEDKSIRWIKWLGGKFGDLDGKVIPFTIRASNG